MFQCLKELIMNCCGGCTELPIVWLSSSLEHLYLCDMKSLTTLCKNIDMEADAYSTSQPIFPKLKRMELLNLHELERWAENCVGEINSSVMFPQLKRLIISACDKLASIPWMPVLTELEISCCKDTTSALVSSIMTLSSLVRLNIGGSHIQQIEDPQQ